MRKANVLITGGAGFIGYHLALYLADKADHRIDIVDNLSRGALDADFMQLLKRKNIRFIKADLLKPRVFRMLRKDYDYIYHLCAIVGVKNVITAPDKVLTVNIMATMSVLDWVRRTQKKLKKFIFMSTSEVYAGTMRHYGINVPTDESVRLCLDDISSPRTTYALSKLAGESACFSFLAGRAFPFTIVRYHNVYGPRMGYEHVVPELLCRAAAAEGALEVYSPKHTRAFCYVSDAVYATVKLAEAGNTAGRIYHVGNSKEEIAIAGLARMICSIVNPVLKIKPMPDNPGSPVRRCPDVNKMLRAVKGFSFVTLDEGLRRTWNWYRSHQKKGMS